MAFRIVFYYPSSQVTPNATSDRLQHTSCLHHLIEQIFTILQTARSLCIHARLKISVFLEVAELQKHGPAAHAGVKLWQRQLAAWSTHRQLKAGETPARGCRQVGGEGWGESTV